jgi:hypothetical protein
VAVRVASAAAIASTTSPPVGPVVGASAVDASASRVAVGDDLTITGSSCNACQLERVRRCLHEYGWAGLAARPEYGYGRGRRCDL